MNIPTRELVAAIKGKLPQTIEIDKRSLVELFISNSFLFYRLVEELKLDRDEAEKAHLSIVESKVSSLSQPEIDNLINKIANAGEE